MKRKGGEKVRMLVHQGYDHSLLPAPSLMAITIRLSVVGRRDSLSVSPL